MLNSSKRTQTGFTLMELQIAAVVSLIVVGGIISLVGNSAQRAATNIEMTQLTRELRTVMQMVSRDIRRAGYDDNELLNFAVNTPSSVAAISLHDDAGNGQSRCVQISYDDRDGNPQVSAYRSALQNGVNVLQGIFTAGAACNAADSEWVNLSDPSRVDVVLGMTLDESVLDIGQNQDGQTVSFSVQRIAIEVSGAMVDDAGIQREIHDNVRVRNGVLTTT